MAAIRVPTHRNFNMVLLSTVPKIGRLWVDEVNRVLGKLAEARGVQFSATNGAIPAVAGVYVIVDAAVAPVRVLYVGESSNLRSRYRKHQKGPTGKSQFRRCFVRANMKHILDTKALSKADEASITEQVSNLHIVFVEVPEPASVRRGSRRHAVEAILTELLAPEFGVDDNAGMDVG